MSVINVEMFSKSLVRTVAFNMFIPNGLRPEVDIVNNPNYKRPCKTVFVLHGYTGWGKGWDVIYELGQQYNLALVFPSAENSFYLDSLSNNYKYGTFVGVELVEYIRKTFGLCLKKEDTFITGLSMGGFGALHVGLSNPETFSKIAALSSALIIHDISGMKPGDSNDIANYHYYQNVFGDLDKVVESEKNPETLILNLIKQKKEIPKMYVACGTEDFLINQNRRFNEFLIENKVPVLYVEDKGDHDMDYWNKYFTKSFEWFISD